MSFTITAGGLFRHHKVYAGRTMQLTNDNTLGTVDNELATADHNRDVAEIHFFLNRLLFDQTQPHTEGHSVGQPQLPALFWSVARFS